MRLSPNSVLPSHIAFPQYDRSAQKAGIVHFGIGAFHRAHQAVYTDSAMNAGDRDWGITGISLRSGDVAEQMNPQGGLYSVTEKSAQGDETRIIGSVQNVIVAPQNPDSVINALASPQTHIVSFTITEKGYCRSADGSLDHRQARQGSVYAYLAAAFQRRRDAGIAGLTLISCDNLASNGAQLKLLMNEFLESDLRKWFESECTCPSTMVDRIVPATTDADRDAVAASIAMRDEAAIVTEPFTQWVIEDNFAGPRPRWDKVGAQFTNDVHAYETAKLRMLNGAHSALAYLGLARGHEYVHQAIADCELMHLVNQLMREEAATSFTPAQGQDLSAYADSLIVRFQNPALNHRLSQIAMDGSQKIPQRWLETMVAQARARRDTPALLNALAAWVLHSRGDNGPVDDPRAAEFHRLWQSLSLDEVILQLFGGSSALIAPLPKELIGSLTALLTPA